MRGAKNVALLVGISLFIPASSGYCEEPSAPPYDADSTGHNVTPHILFPQAVEIINSYVQAQGIDVSLHYLRSVALVYLGGRTVWHFIWELRTPSDGGQLFFDVDMDGTVRSHGGR